MNAKKRKRIDRRRKRRQERRLRAETALETLRAEFRAWAATPIGRMLLDLNQKLYSNGPPPPEAT